MKPSLMQLRAKALKELVGARGSNFSYLTGYYDGLRDNDDSMASANPEVYMKGFWDARGDLYLWEEDGS